MKTKPKPKPKSFFFCGSGWGGIYNIGVYKGLTEKYSYEYLNTCKFGGNSSGATVALGAALGLKWEEMYETYLEIVDLALQNGIITKMSNYHRYILNKHIIDSNTYKKLNNRLFIGVTFFSNNYKIYSNWNNNQELIDTLQSSFHIPGYCNYLCKVNNKIAIDGGFGDEYYKIHPDTVVINPCTKNGDIYCNPSISTTFSLYPSIHKINLYFNKGYMDGKKYIFKKKKYSKELLPWYLIYIFWVIRYLQEIKFKYILFFILLCIIF